MKNRTDSRGRIMLIRIMFIWILIVPVSAFAPPLVERRCDGLHMTSTGLETGLFCRQRSTLFSVPTESDSEQPISETLSSTESPVVPPPVATDPEQTEPPLNIPSPVLLATSMVLAIASTGSVFELSGGNPQFGMPITAGIAVVGIPLCLFLFYAAILKGIAETEEDDEAFLGR